MAKDTSGGTDRNDELIDVLETLPLNELSSIQMSSTTFYYSNSMGCNKRRYVHGLALQCCNDDLKS